MRALFVCALALACVDAAGAIGGALFIFAVFLAATAPDPDPNCAADECEV